MPSIFSTFRPFNVQKMFNGKSPLLIVQIAETISPEFIASSPKSNGTICGGTIKSYTKGFLWKSKNILKEVAYIKLK